VSTRGEWLRTHRRGIVGAIAALMGIFVPIPGYVAAALFWPGGIHDLDTTGNAIAFLCVVVGVSAFVWGAIANAALPRREGGTAAAPNR
jgi:hypothetical protein